MNDLQVRLKIKAAKAVIKYVKDGMVLGVGSGTTITYFIEELGKLVSKDNLEILAVPSSYDTKFKLVEKGVKITTLKEHPNLNLAVDGADEIDPDLNLIKGGGGCLFLEKIVADAAKEFIVIADESKLVGRLGEKNPIPVEVHPFALGHVVKRIESIDGKPVLRVANTGKVGPVITDNGNFVVDVKFHEIKDPKSLEKELNMIPGVIENGLFIGMASRALITTPQKVLIKTQK